MLGVRGAYSPAWITVEIDADRACDKALQIHHALGVDAQAGPSSRRVELGSGPGCRRRRRLSAEWPIFRARMSRG